MDEPPQPSFVIGEMVDARDSVNHWYESRVLERRTTGTGETEYYVHFRGWQPRFDTWVSGDAIAPVHTKTQDWRPTLRVGDALEFSERPGRWLYATVTDVSRSANSGETMFVAVRKESCRGSQEPSIWVDVDCEKLCPTNTHLRNHPPPSTPAMDNARAGDKDASSRAGQLGVSLWHLRKQGLLTDLELEVAGEIFLVHRCVLAAASGVFRAMFSAHTKDKDARRLYLPDLLPQTFFDMIKFVYTSCIDTSLDNDHHVEDFLEASEEGVHEASKVDMDVDDTESRAMALNRVMALPSPPTEMGMQDQDKSRKSQEKRQKRSEAEPYSTGRLVRLVLASDRFDIRSLTAACEEQLSNSLNSRNLLRILALSRHLHLRSLEAAAQKFFVDNASDIVISPSFGTLLAGDKGFELAWEAGWDEVVDDTSAYTEDESKD
uniref:BTB domain-containing protein n=1 Tax=Pinguiococcus pyrenoidosus TaxID=172671 RepID=A0A7R9YBM8_9STRA|mmetsp:Transcript_16204/g.61766  ORF Transcript_16204/g.61766 Transcript_16204/m.61766 type:complete len:434 (+) Transcript_16204:82-1383(+)